MDRAFKIGLLQESSELGNTLNKQLRTLRPELRLDAPLHELKEALATFDLVQANKALRFVHESPLILALKKQKAEAQRMFESPLTQWVEKQKLLRESYVGLSSGLNAPLCATLSASLLELKSIHDNLFSYTRHVDLTASRSFCRNLYAQIRLVDSSAGLMLIPRPLELEGEIHISIGEGPVDLKDFQLDPEEVSHLDEDEGADEVRLKDLVTFEVDMTEDNIQNLCVECGADMLVTRGIFNPGARKQLVFQSLSCRCAARPKFREQN
jgi:hypothetical protein